MVFFLTDYTSGGFWLWVRWPRTCGKANTEEPD